MELQLRKNSGTHRFSYVFRYSFLKIWPSQSRYQIFKENAFFSKSSFYSASMSLFDNIVKTALEAASAKSPEHAGLANSVLQFIQSQGGLEGIQKTFQEKGFGEVISSWVSNSENLPISGKDLVSIFGSSAITDIIKSAGLKEESGAEQIASVLPVLVNGLTPEGKVSGEDLLKTGMNMLKGKLF
jgi:uncharacterized protein YidB (DUF937 family)